MNFIISAKPDVGLTKTTNQDSLIVRVANTPSGRMAFCVLCDGMGGLEKGEVASASVIHAFDSWFYNVLPGICNEPIEDETIREQWSKIINDQNEAIKKYGASCNIRLGTTVVAILITQSRYYILNVGDSRAYEISDRLRRITNDQTLVAREVELGNMTEEEAEHDERRNVLLQCVGASEEVYPDMFFGVPEKNGVYMLCSDGFRHEITAEEMYEKLSPYALVSQETMDNNAQELIELNKMRKERDNISVALIRTF